jgi:hypothetical protein
VYSADEQDDVFYLVQLQAVDYLFFTVAVVGLVFYAIVMLFYVLIMRTPLTSFLPLLHLTSISPPSHHHLTTISPSHHHLTTISPPPRFLSFISLVSFPSHSFPLLPLKYFLLHPFLPLASFPLSLLSFHSFSCVVANKTNRML